MRYMDKKLERLGLHLGDLEDDARDQVSEPIVILPNKWFYLALIIDQKNQSVQGLDDF
jgi:hypothetical protein